MTEQKVISTIEKTFWDNWTYIIIAVGVVLLLLLIAGGIFYCRKRKKEKAAENPPEPEKEVLKSSALRKIWKSFLREIPGDLRHQLMVFDQFVVFGGWGAGKTMLIDNYTDWQGYAREFYPSYTANPLLQIYLGSKVLVQEIPAALLSDTTSQVRKALLKLWKPLFRHKAPTVVVVLNGAGIGDEENYADYLTREAQYIRGKINLLSSICKKPVKVRIALTHLDLIEGFTEFSEFLVEKNIPLKIHFSSNEEISDLGKGLESYEDYLTDALITLSADKYLKAVSFLRQSPKVFEHLRFFITKLTGHDPLSVEPQIVDICLTLLEEKKVQFTNPFAAQITREQIAKYDPYAWHRRTACALGSVAVALLVASFVYELSLLKDRKNEASLIEASFSEGYEKKVHSLFPDAYLNKHALSKFTPDFFKKNHRAITRDLIEAIRRYYFYPRLDIYSAGAGKKNVVDTLTKQMGESGKRFIQIHEDLQDKYMYVIGLMYATKSNGLGKLIKNEGQHISQSLAIPDTIIKDYISYNKSEWPVAYEVKNISLVEQGNSIDQLQRLVDYHGRYYFALVAKMYGQQIISENELEKVLHETDHLLMIIKQYEIHDFYIKLVELIKQETNLTINVDTPETKQFRLEKDNIEQFLIFIKGSSLETPQRPENIGFDSFDENVRLLLNYNKLNVDHKFKFSFGNDELTFSAQQWVDLLNRSKICIFVRRFVSYYKTPNGFLFFSAKDDFEDIVMNSTNDGGFLFVGKARVDKRFTKNALEKSVKPQVTNLPVLVKSLPIPEQDKNNFMNFLRREVDFYGQKYADSYRKFYLQFDIQINSAGALRFALNQMFQPSSTFMTFLQTIKENTQIETGKNEYLMIIAGKMNDFAFIKRLLEEKDGVYPELDKYKILLNQMKAELQQEIPATPKKKEDPFALIKSDLTPLGKIAFAINRQENDSYLNLTTQWLESVGIAKQWRDIFLAPVWTAYFLGMNEVEQKLAQSWAEMVETNINPLYSKFPFNPLATDEASQEDVRNATHPQGRFWQSFQKSISPYCTANGGNWKNIPGPYGLPNFPPKMLMTLKKIAGLRDLFWDKDGNAQPLECKVKANPLPKMVPEEPVPVLSYVTIGQSSFMSFNQKTNWAPLKIEWQNSCSASVGLELMPYKGDVKYRSTIEIPNSNWCFYKLLKKTEEYKDMERAPASNRKKGNGYWLRNDIRWVIDPTSDRIKSHPIEIKLTFKKDPWDTIILPRY